MHFLWMIAHAALLGDAMHKSRTPHKAKKGDRSCFLIGLPTRLGSIPDVHIRKGADYSLDTLTADSIALESSKILSINATLAMSDDRVGFLIRAPAPKAF